MFYFVSFFTLNLRIGGNTVIFVQLRFQCSNNSFMKVLYTSAECYPVAKVGGLADVVGSLPKYLKKIGVNTSVIIPAYDMPWFDGQLYKIAHKGSFHLGDEHLYFEIRNFLKNRLVFHFIPSIFHQSLTGLVCTPDGMEISLVTKCREI